jgi:hypothetical protein
VYLIPHSGSTKSGNEKDWTSFFFQNTERIHVYHCIGPYSSQSSGEAIKYCVFTVLPFGLSSTAYIFTKVVRPLVAHGRKDGIKVTVYLDDSLGLILVAPPKRQSNRHSLLNV